MTTYTLTTFQDGDTILASEMNDNFQYCLADTTTKVNALEASIGSDINSAKLAVLQTIYPVGSIYIGTMATCPFASLFGTWTLKSSGMVLQGSDVGHAAGTTIAAGLPNITGRLSGVGNRTAFEIGATNGAFYTSSSPGYDGAGQSSSSVYNSQLYANFNAARSSSVYGNSTTVQPPAYVVNIWERTA